MAKPDTRMYRIVVHFRDNSKDEKIIQGQKAAKKYYRETLQRAAKFGAWVDAYQVDGDRMVW